MFLKRGRRYNGLFFHVQRKIPARFVTPHRDFSTKSLARPDASEH
jgi:hypothetical protein